MDFHTVDLRINIGIAFGGSFAFHVQGVHARAFHALAVDVTYANHIGCLQGKFSLVAFTGGVIVP